MYDVSAQGVDEHMINVRYYYCCFHCCFCCCYYVSHMLQLEYKMTVFTVTLALKRLNRQAKNNPSNQTIKQPKSFFFFFVCFCVRLNSQLDRREEGKLLRLFCALERYNNSSS